MQPQFILVVDTETIGLEKTFCYDIGYIVARLTDNKYVPIKKAHYLVSENWNNAPLFETGYYANKRPHYLDLIEQNKASIHTLNYIFKHIKQDIDKYGIEDYFAYNSKFDRKVFEFNANYFNQPNPLGDLNEHDIQSIASVIHQSSEYKNYCMDNNRVTESGYLSTNAETTYRFISQDHEFCEEHTGLEDVLIELDILNSCLDYDNFSMDSKTAYFIPSERPSNNAIIVIVDNDNEKVINIKYKVRKKYKNKTTFIV